MTVFRKELRAGAAALLVWAAAVGGLMAVCVGMYPSFAGSMDDVSALFSGMGDFSAAFGLDKLELGTIMGFYGTECGNILGLGGAFYAALTAMGMLAGRREAIRRNSCSLTPSAACGWPGKSWRRCLPWCWG